jgi:hypothetical protein
MSVVSSVVLAGRVGLVEEALESALLHRPCDSFGTSVEQASERYNQSKNH